MIWHGCSHTMYDTDVEFALLKAEFAYEYSNRLACVGQGSITSGPFRCVLPVHRNVCDRLSHVRQGLRVGAICETGY
jgi:hypothetical protein